MAGLIAVLIILGTFFALVLDIRDEIYNPYQNKIPQKTIALKSIITKPSPFLNPHLSKSTLRNLEINSA